LPGAPPSHSSGSSSGSGSFSEPRDAGQDAEAIPPSGFCDLTACAAGCACTTRSVDDAGACEAVCDCPDAAIDAGDADAGDAADDASIDGGDAGDAGGACGVVTCGEGCGCISPKTSECACSATGCQN